MDSKLTDWIIIKNNKLIYDHRKLSKNKNLQLIARDLRKAGNLLEVLFWKAFKNKELLHGCDLNRQTIIGNYIIDFFIPELGLVFEIDGESHNYKGDYDLLREDILRSFQLDVFRFLDSEVRKSMDEVGDQVIAVVNQRKSSIEYLSIVPSLSILGLASVENYK